MCIVLYMDSKFQRFNPSRIHLIVLFFMPGSVCPASCNLTGNEIWREESSVNDYSGVTSVRLVPLPCFIIASFLCLQQHVIAVYNKIVIHELL